jgi:hypothetical protein|tara:strand:- start:457 stop:777 length:321 start_codon:yes stop_codon:yes gene_type:complete
MSSHISFSRYGTAVFGTDRYNSQSVAITLTGVSSTGAVGNVSIEAVDTGTNVTVSVNGVRTLAKVGTPIVSPIVFDFSTVKDNYERRRTAYVHRRSNNADRTVKVA